jgi:hypothetical protein
MNRRQIITGVAALAVAAAIPAVAEARETVDFSKFRPSGPSINHRAVRDYMKYVSKEAFETYKSKNLFSSNVLELYINDVRSAIMTIAEEYHNFFIESNFISRMSTRYNLEILTPIVQIKLRESEIIYRYCSFYSIMLERDRWVRSDISVSQGKQVDRHYPSFLSS